MEITVKTELFKVLQRPSHKPMTEEQYISERVEDQIKWYEKKSARNKKYYLWSNASIIVFAALIPFLAGLSDEEVDWPKYLIAILGVLTATLTGISALYKFQEKWATYRMTGESLKREKLLYQTRTQPYDSMPSAFNQFVSNVESLMSSENSGWTQIINQKDEQAFNSEAP
ncbi:MAG: DUF4231 domain-containing protein [Eudoraea sp.]|nr:DUF4231 domain-containing protein [Eudoraea sp.]